MKTIYKYPLQLADKQELELPVSAEVLDVQLQGEQLCLWAVVDPEERLFEAHAVYIEGTGQGPLNFDHRATFFRRTVQQRGMVWHLFLVKA